MCRMCSTLALLVFVLTQASWAGTFRVERDGSGDYIEIQEAAEAAASGDTLLIGPGRWDQMFTYSIPAGGWTDEVIVAVDYKDLTLIGAGQGVTIVGPETAPPFGVPGPIAIVGGTDNHLGVESMTIENMRTGVYEWGASLAISNVHFKDCYKGSISWAVEGAVFMNCLFERCSSSGIQAGSRSSGMQIIDCAFYGSSSIHIVIQGVDDVVVERCTFRDGNGALLFDGGSVGVMRDCEVESGYGPHIVSTMHSHLTMNNCRLFGGRYKQVQVSSYATLSGASNIYNGTNIMGDGYAVIYANLAYVNLHDSHIFRGDALYAVKFYDYPMELTIEQHLENNYWGTSDPDSIAAWIFDEHDDPGLNIQTFVEPFHEHPISNEKASISGLKDLFR